MKALIQRVKKASVTINGELFSSINKGLLIFLGIQKNDSEENANKLLDKITKLRIFEDENDKMNLSLFDTCGQMLIVSQFTLCGNCAKGTRPSFDDAQTPQKANELYEYFISKAQETGLKIQTGQFGAMMEVELINDGPVTFMIEK